MTKDEMVALLRSVGVNENTVTAMSNAYELGADYEREVCAKMCDKEVEEWKYDADVVDVAIAIRARGEA